MFNWMLHEPLALYLLIVETDTGHAIPHEVELTTAEAKSLRERSTQPGVTRIIVTRIGEIK